MGVVIKAFHNRNPVLREEPLIDPWGGAEYPMVNEPFVEVELEGLPPGEYEVGLRTEVHSTRQQVSIDVARQALYFMHRDLADASRYPPSLERRLPRLYPECAASSSGS